MTWNEYEKWSFSLVKDVFAHLQFLLYCVLLSLNKRALEIGSGTGLQGCFVSYFGIEVVSVDNDAKVARMAHYVSNYYRSKDVSFVVADARYLPFKPRSFRLSFSQGLLEHLDDKNIIAITLEASRAVKGKILFSVPSVYFPEQSFGDERLLYSTDWKTIFAQFNAKVKYYQFDFQSIKNSILAKKIPKPWHIQVEVSSK